MAAHHAPIRERLLALIERGQHEGVFRVDPPAGWLLGTYFALVHLAGDQVSAGLPETTAAEPVLLATLVGAFGAPSGSTRAAQLEPTTEG